MKITDIKCAVLANSPVIRIITDEGVTGWSQIETPKPYLQPIVLQLKGWIVGQDPVNVERVMRRIELTRIAYLADRPRDIAEASRTLEALAEEALDHDCANHARIEEVRLILQVLRRLQVVRGKG